jgi:ribosome-associated protein
MARRSRMKLRRNAGIDQAFDGEDATDRGPSKTALKREADKLKQLGVAVSELPNSRRKQIDMPEDLREAIEAYRRMTAHGAKKRQMQYVGKLLRGIDPAPLREAVEDFEAGRVANAKRAHEMEVWRDRLVNEDDAVTEWMDLHPETNVQQLRSLIRAARRDRKGEAPNPAATRSLRALFEFLLEA